MKQCTNLINFRRESKNSWVTPRFEIHGTVVAFMIKKASKTNQIFLIVDCVEENNHHKTQAYKFSSFEKAVMVARDYFTQVFFESTPNSTLCIMEQLMQIVDIKEKIGNPIKYIIGTSFGTLYWYNKYWILDEKERRKQLDG